MLSRAGSRRAGAQYLWGSLDELFVNLTSPLRIQAFIGSLLPDPRLTQRAKREQRAGSRKTGTRHHESDGSDPHQQGDDDPTGHGSKPTRSAASSAARTLNPRETRYGPWGGASELSAPVLRGHSQLVEGSTLLPREIDTSDRSQQAHVTASHSTNARVRSRRW